MKTQLLFLLFYTTALLANDGSTSILFFTKKYLSVFSMEKEFCDPKRLNFTYENNLYVSGVITNPPTEFLISPSPSNGSSPPNVGEYFSGTFYNLGTNIIHSYTLKWKVDQGPIITEYFSGLSILPNQWYTYTNTIPTVGLSTVSGKHILTIWIENPNNVPDTTLNDNTFTKTFYVFNEFYPPKTVVYEYITGTWCNSCVRGYPILKNMKHYHPDFISVAVHGGNDPMTNQNYYSNMIYFCSGGEFPGGSINRNLPCQPLIDQLSLENEYNIERNKIVYGKIDFSTQDWNPITRTMTIQTAARFPMNISCDYEMYFKQGLIVVEDGITGTGAEYAQQNGYYNSGIDLYDWQYINWSLLGNPIPSTYMIYNHVARAQLNDSFLYPYLGSSSIPMSINYNTPYNNVFSHVLPIDQNEHNIKLIAVLYNAFSGQIVNAKEVPLNVPFLSTEENSIKLNVSIYPNPSRGVFNFKTQKNFDLSIFDLLGKEVFNSKNTANESEINLTQLEEGIYLAKIQKIIIK
jgi:hypothetical protein